MFIIITDTNQMPWGWGTKVDLWPTNNTRRTHL